MWKNIVESYRTQVTIRRMLDTKGYKYTLRIGLCNIYHFSTAKIVLGTRLNVTLYLRCLSC